MGEEDEYKGQHEDQEEREDEEGREEWREVVKAQRFRMQRKKMWQGVAGLKTFIPSSCNTFDEPTCFQR